jgi:hypothetical protein
MIELDDTGFQTVKLYTSGDKTEFDCIGLESGSAWSIPH